MAIIRAGTMLSVATAIMHLYDHRHRDIKPNRIYTSHDVARFLGVNRSTVVSILKLKEMQGKMVRGNYRISGQSIIEYLKK
ncbi:MAG: hypothetical protein V3R66_01355 [Rhodospirillales bacterium]